MHDSSPSASTQTTSTRPTRGADKNQDIAADPATTDRLLPSLDPGITLLDIDGGRGVPVVQSLVLDHLLVHEGPALWVDADGHATTTAFARLAPSPRLLDRISVARGFTAYQHYGAVCDLPDEDPALVVAPAIDARYREDDTLGEGQAQTLLARAIAQLQSVADRHDCPVLVTRTKSDSFATPVATAADHRIECAYTRMGPRFVGDEFETLRYPVDGEYDQTTFAYWRHLVQHRAKVVGLDATAESGQPDGTNTVGTGVTAGGGPATLTADPLLDAWTGVAGGGR